MSAILRIGITTGDEDGIGTEVVSKALRRMGPRPGVRFFLWRSPLCPSKHLKRLDSKFRRRTFSSWTEALRANSEMAKADASALFDICSPLAPPFWVEEAAKVCMADALAGMVTGPLSKTLIAQCGMADIGHTSILKRVGKVNDVYMGFFGKYFNVTLFTDHIPLASVAGQLSESKLERAVLAAAAFQTQLRGSKLSLPIAILGLNPHAGEERLLGGEEADIVEPLIAKLRAKGVRVVGPLVPDAAFLKQNWNKYSMYLALYHDQGLIPFKAFHGQRSGVHISLGLPFVRTSVDHGTAKDIFGAEKADDRSMSEAIDWAIRLARIRSRKL